MLHLCCASALTSCDACEQDVTSDDASALGRLLCDRETLSRVLRRLKGHEDAYVSSVLRFRQEYLSLGRRAADVEDLRAALAQRSKRVGGLGSLKTHDLRRMVRALKLACRLINAYIQCLQHNQANGASTRADTRGEGALF